jgi:nitrate/nitrite transporter NarK
MLATYTLFYIMTVYSMTFSTGAAPVGLGLPRNEVLWMLMMAVIGFGVMVPVAGLLADAFGRRKSMIVITSMIILFALFAFKPLLGSGQPVLVFAFLLLGLSLMGLTFGPMGALLPELFPTEVRYTGASFSYNVSSIRRLRRTVYCRLATGQLWSDGGRPLPRGHGRADADCAAVDPRNAPSVAVIPYCPARRAGHASSVRLLFHLR